MTHYGAATATPTPKRRWTDHEEPIPHRPNVSNLVEVLVPEFMIWVNGALLTAIAPVSEARMREIVGVWRERERTDLRVVRRDVLVCRSEWAEVEL